MDDIEASDSMVKRIRIMAQFIKERHAAEFEAFWRDNWPGKAEARESLEFFATPLLHEMLALQRKVYL